MEESVWHVMKVSRISRASGWVWTLDNGLDKTQAQLDLLQLKSVS